MISLIVYSCDDESLGNGYYYLPEYEAIDLGFPYGAVVYKSSKKYIFNDIKIKGNVIEVNSNEDFIIAKRNTVDTISLTETLDYYIIDKEKDTVYGPYNEFYYNEKRNILNLSEKFILGH